MNHPVLGHDPFTKPANQALNPLPCPAEAPRCQGGSQTAATDDGHSKAQPRVEQRPEVQSSDSADTARPIEEPLRSRPPQPTPLCYRAQDVDPFGYDAACWRKVEPFFQFLFESYWRVQVRGIENIPDQGRVLLVANHSGTLPYDGAMIKVAVEQRHPAGRPVRFLVEDFVFHFPFLGAFMNRIGGVRANPDNASRLLQNEQLVAVFPEGIKGIGKLFRDRYKLQRFGRGGFVKLALRTNSPIIPVAVVGAEEIHPLLARLSWLARPLGLPYLPVTPIFPLLGPLGMIPLPSKWLLEFGKPFDSTGFSAEDAEDPLKITAIAERIRDTIQQMVNGLLKLRQHSFWG